MEHAKPEQRQTTRRKPRARRLALALSVIAAAGLTVTFFGCVHRSGGTWMIDSAARPDGWPELSPVGEVVLREYPTTRAATVEINTNDTDSNHTKDQTGPMFRTLFNHIKDNNIAMTAPVDMSFSPSSEQQTASGRGMTRMAFLYRTTSLGEPGVDGQVKVQDAPPTIFASTGVRGPYNRKNYEQGLDLVTSWLTSPSQREWSAAGPPRYLGYNGPFTLWFLRYGEVQVPLRRVESTPQSTSQVTSPTTPDSPSDSEIQ